MINGGIFLASSLDGLQSLEPAAAGELLFARSLDFLLSQVVAAALPLEDDPLLLSLEDDPLLLPLEDDLLLLPLEDDLLLLSLEVDFLLFPMEPDLLSLP